jgi:hypothetical protein
MSEESRNKWKQKYINIKRGVVATTLTTVTLIDLKAFAIDLFYSKLKRFGYKTAVVVLIGPYIQFAGVTLYLLGNIGKLRLVAVTLSDIGSKITCGEMGILNWMWIAIDMCAFGEPVPIIESTDLMLLRNETSLIDEILTLID